MTVLGVATVSFPCQSSSQASVRTGRQDPRGEEVLSNALKMIENEQPVIVVLENAKGFLSVEQGGYFNWLRGELHSIGYPRFEWRVLATHHFGLPQQRERLYMVAFRDDMAASVNFRFPVGDVTKTPFALRVPQEAPCKEIRKHHTLRRAWLEGQTRVGHGAARQGWLVSAQRNRLQASDGLPDGVSASDATVSSLRERRDSRASQKYHG